MVVDPSVFTYEYLSGLKFKELQKLSVQFQVNKRWAKKQELIENLLALKENDPSCQKSDEEKGWIDGSVIFKDLEPGDDEAMRRLTVSISSKSSTESVDPRLTFEVPQNGKNLLEGTSDSRKTFIIPPSMEELRVEPVEDSRATYEIPPKGNLLDEKFDSRATYEISQKGKNLLEGKDENLKDQNKQLQPKQKKSADSSKIQKNQKKFTFDAGTNKEIVQPQVKTLTIPCTRTLRRTRKDAEDSKSTNSSIKISEKSINIKKSKRQPTSKLDLIRSPATSKKPYNKPLIVESLIKTQSRNVSSSKIPTRLQFNEEKLPINEKETADGNKENVKRILRRKSKTADEVFVKKQNSAKVSFMSPPVTLKRNSKICLPIRKTPLKKDTRSVSGGWNPDKSQTPKTNLSLPTKPITATKMPDFSKIHQKQFEQMDSLHEYMKKKEERTRRLFGTPQPPLQAKTLNKPGTLFKFQSAAKLETKLEKINENSATPFKKKESNIKAAQKEAFINKLPSMKLQTDIKDKNRSHIHGVRTNKRFELLLKFRNM